MPPYNKEVKFPRSLLILSSFKPASKCSKAYLEQQKEAMASWLKLGAAIILVNKPDDVPYADPKIIFREPKQEPPAIYDIIGEGLLFIRTEPSESIVMAIVNSDIILTEDFNKVLTLTDKHNNNWAAASKRYHYSNDISKADIKDWGVDVFAASARVWKMTHDAMPKYNAQLLRIGKNMWDSWLSGYFVASIISSKYIDLTPLKCVLHKEHPVSENNHNLPADCSSLIEVGAGFPSVKYK